MFPDIWPLIIIYLDAKHHTGQQNSHSSRIRSRLCRQVLPDTEASTQEVGSEAGSYTGMPQNWSYQVGQRGAFCELLKERAGTEILIALIRSDQAGCSIHDKTFLLLCINLNTVKVIKNFPQAAPKVEEGLSSGWV